jgi:centrosomal protein CEP76
MDCDDEIYFSVIKKDIVGALYVVGVGHFDWRKVLLNGRTSSLVELFDQMNPDMSMGILDIVLELSTKDRVREDEYEFQLKLKQRKLEELASSFFLEAKQWWNDYLQMRETHSTRLVKIFAINEFGKRFPTSHFLQPVNCIFYLYRSLD